MGIAPHHGHRALIPDPAPHIESHGTMESICRAATTDDQGGTAGDADERGPQHAAWCRPKAETLPEGRERSALTGRRTIYPGQLRSIRTSWPHKFHRE